LGKNNRRANGGRSRNAGFPVFIEVYRRFTAKYPPLRRDFAADFMPIDDGGGA
jgi:hypothetical protein